MWYNPDYVFCISLNLIVWKCSHFLCIDSIYDTIGVKQVDLKKNVGCILLVTSKSFLCKKFRNSFLEGEQSKGLRSPRKNFWFWKHTWVKSIYLKRRTEFFAMHSCEKKKRESSLFSYIESSYISDYHINIFYVCIQFVWFVLEPDDEKFSCPVLSEDGSIRIHLSQ